MAKYYAVVWDVYIWRDLRTSQLEIYETKYQARKHCPPNCEVVEVEVRRANKVSEDG